LDVIEGGKNHPRIIHIVMNIFYKIHIILFLN
jgi:hypothetical protein